MASVYLQPTVIAQTAMSLLLRQLVVARTVWSNAINPNQFVGAYGDTVTIRVPARRTARTRVLRAGTPIVNDPSVEFGVPVRLTTDVYNGADISDEDLTLSINDFGAQVLMPQIRAVAEGVDDAVAAQIVGASYESSMTIDADDFAGSGGPVHDWWDIATEADQMLSDQNVPLTDRWFLMGSAVRKDILRDTTFRRADSAGDQAASTMLQRATLPTIAGFTPIASNAIPATDAYFYHRTAFVLVARAPKVPQGAAFATTRSLGETDNPGGLAGLEGLSVRWLMDYNYTTTTDRSLVNTWVGTAEVTDPDDPSDEDSASSLLRAVRVSGGGSSS